ncbi:MAG: starch synthase [Epulopiscium sp. Nele67-Bin004]|nr:MAG: starch synthase [Epulopiscium sp. Nele67-Bin004]
MKCLFVASEVVPYAKTGGLADVAGALPKELREQGLDVRVVMPYYRQIKGKIDEDKAKLDIWYTVNFSWRTQGVDVLYDETHVPTYFLKNDMYFDRDALYGYDDDCERFAYFCRAVVELLTKIDFIPDVIHCNDWQTGPIALMIKEQYQWDQKYQNIKTVFTIHNMKYQGIFGKEALDMLWLSDAYMTPDKLEFNGGVSFMKAGLMYADHINTVSPTYAEELKTWQYGCGLDSLIREVLYWKTSGILNGIDTDRYNPETDAHIYEHYNADSIEKKKINKEKFREEFGLAQDGSMMVAIISRLTNQKGLDLMKHTVQGQWFMDKLMSLGIQFVVLGTGDDEYENMFKHFKWAYGDRAGVFLEFDESLAQKIYAAADVFLMPSEFEPCGLGQLMAMRYGAVPVVRQTGGLKDTVIHYNYMTGEGTGFEFAEYSGYWLYEKIAEAHECYTNKPKDFEKIQHNGMTAAYGWAESATKYADLYRLICGKTAAELPVKEVVEDELKSLDDLDDEVEQPDVQ